MKKSIALFAIAAGMVAAPASVAAQTTAAQPFIGVSAGYHDLGVDTDGLSQVAGIEINDGSPIIGVVGGVDFPVGERMFAGVEANYHFGTSVIDSEYGASLRLGMRDAGGAKYYLRGGYQQVDIDLEKLVDALVPVGSLAGVDDSTGDFLVGAGAEFPIGGAALRFNVDTVGFDSVRGTAGVLFSF